MKEIRKECDMCGAADTQIMNIEHIKEDSAIKTIKIPAAAGAKGLRMDLCPTHHRELIAQLIKMINRLGDLATFVKTDPEKTDPETA